MTRILGGKDGLPDGWDKTAEMLRKTAETVLGVTFEKRKGDRETWWWNEEVQENIKKRKRQRKHGTKQEMKILKRYTKKRRVRQRRQLQWRKEVCMTICRLDWKQKKVKRSCTDWLGRETEQEKIYIT